MDGSIEFGSSLPYVESNLRYLSDDDRYSSEKPYYFAGPLIPAEEHLRTNLSCTDAKVPIMDLRGYEHKISIEKQGFEFMNRQSNVHFIRGIDEPAKIHDYISETVALVKERLGAEDCVCYSYRVQYTDLSEYILLLD